MLYLFSLLCIKRIKNLKRNNPTYGRSLNYLRYCWYFTNYATCPLLSLFCPWISLVCPWLSLVGLCLSLVSPWMSLVHLNPPPCLVCSVPQPFSKNRSLGQFFHRVAINHATSPKLYRSYFPHR